ncbi:GntR family transcriptional regulator [Camelimonas lactis]|uniref:DNA-binding GntR family transcriptional regulator n=1 Tax=Camelimonas lactis TaxID=659006 RepID=A0A4V2RXZ8_9HYPH|nr:GntR family transcriptional regulator [Camelimonas lactis]TCO15998.1 DNA-binding GntR family transcriptional regulator [Camelimonas lactis]
METETNHREGVRTESLALQAYRHFRRQLMAGRYKPGQKIKLKEVSEELGISATPIREALGRLVSEHALFQIDRRSVRVPIMDADRYRHISDVRILLEGEAAARAAQLATGSEIAALEEIHEALCVAHDQGKMEDLMAVNERFHDALCNLAAMPVLHHMVENLWLQCGPTMNAFLDYPPRAPRQRHAHLMIIDALRKRDSEAARKALALDIRASVERIVAYLDEHRVNAG